MNVLIIQADQHRWDCLGAYGNSDVRTPHIDALAADGVVYEHSFCPYPVCTPSRYSFVSGLYVHQHLGWTNHCTLPPALPTWTRLLKRAGFRTCAVGKMHFTPTYLDTGFEEMVLAEQNGPGRYDDDYHRSLRAEGLVDTADLVDQEREYRSKAPPSYWANVGAARSNLPEAFHSTTWIGDRAVDRLSQWRSGGHAMMVSFIKPHHPFDPPEPWDGIYDPQTVPLRPGWTDAADPDDVAYARGYFSHESLTEAQVRRATAFYYGTISQIDHHVGRMIAALKATGVYGQTMVVYNSDHGEYLGHRHLLLKGGRMYDPLVRVPLVVKWPGNVRRGERCLDLVSTVDLAPTIAKAAGCEAPAFWPGIDLSSGKGREVVFAEVRRGRRVEYMARSRTRKLLLSEDEPQCRLYDLERDPLERVNVLGDGDYAEDARALREAVLRWLAHETPAPVYLDEDARAIARRRPGELEEMRAYFEDGMRRLAD